MTWAFVFNRANRSGKVASHQNSVPAAPRGNRLAFPDNPQTKLKRAEVEDYRLPGGPGTGGPLFVSPQALTSKSTPLNPSTQPIPLTTTPPGKPCFICGSIEWWWREPSPLGGPGGWLCSICHPDPKRPGVTAGIITTPGRKGVRDHL